MERYGRMARVSENDKGSVGFMDTIFRNSDFKLCYLPVPKGYPYSQTHAGVDYSEKGIGGHHWFVVSSPYPNPQRSFLERGVRFFCRKVLRMRIRPSDWFENPMLYFGEDSIEPPITFTPFPNNPLMDTPEDTYGSGAFNSDPDIYIENDTIYVLNREIKRKVGDNGVLSYLTKIYLIRILFNNGEFQAFKPLCLFNYDYANASPSLLFFRNKYRIFSLVTSSYNTGEPCEYAEMRISDSVDGPYDETYKICVETIDFHPWHFSVFSYNDRLYSIVACIKGNEKQRCYQMLGEFSDDLSTLHIFQMPLTNLKSYRGDAIVLSDDKFVLYTSIIESFPESHSVDGRDILMAGQDFNLLLHRLREYEKKNIDM